MRQGENMSESERSQDWDRLEKGKEAEAKIITRFRESGYEADPYGQEVLKPRMRNILKKCRNALGEAPLFRWHPDFMVAGEINGKAMAALIDGKSTSAKYKDDYSIELSSVLALRGFSASMLMDCYFVFDDWGVIAAGDVERAVRHSGRVIYPSSKPQGGSGTPFVVFKRSFAMRFEDVFPSIIKRSTEQDDECFRRACWHCEQCAPNWSVSTLKS
jgi:hypothetical protein